MNIVRAATVEDAEAVAAVQTRSWQATYRGLMPQEFLDAMDRAPRAARWRAALTAPLPGDRVLVAEADGQVAGFVAVGPSRDVGPDGVGEVRAIYLLPGSQGQGLGRALMAAAVAALRADGFGRLALWVLDANLPAKRFYAAAGWRPDGTVKVDASRGFPLTEERWGIDVV